MRAVRQHAYGGPDVLVCENLATPDPGPDEVLLRVHAACVNHFDILSRKGLRALPLPRIVGIDCTGVVEVAPASRPDLKPGTAVVVLGERMGNGGPGAYASHVCVHEEEVFPVPDGVDLDAAACLGISYLTAWYALTRRSPPAPGATVLVPGAGGGVGGAALQVAGLLGHRVFATSSGPEKCAEAERYGAERCFDYVATDVVKAIREATVGRGVDVVVNAVGGSTIAEGLACLALRGKLLTIGTAYGRDFSFDGFDFLFRELELVGVNITPATPAERYTMFLELCGHLRSGALRVPIAEVLPLDRAGDAHRLVEGRRHFGKVLLRP